MATPSHRLAARGRRSDGQIASTRANGIDTRAQSAYIGNLFGGHIMMQHSAPGSFLRAAPWQAAFYTYTLALLLAQSHGVHAADATAAAIEPSHAQFGGQSADALAEGRHVSTDCTHTWTDKDGKIYCFSNEAAEKSFLEDPVEN